MEEKKEFYLIVRGEKVAVNEEVYRAYTRPIRAEQRRKRRTWKCRKLSETGGYYVRCKERCESCPYYLAGNSSLGNITSLDRLVDYEVEIEDKSSDPEADYIERETTEEEYAKLQRAISQLTPRQQEMVRLVFFEGKTQSEVAKQFGIEKQSVCDAMRRIYASIKKFLEKDEENLS